MVATNAVKRRNFILQLETSKKYLFFKCQKIGNSLHRDTFLSDSEIILSQLQTRTRLFFFFTNSVCHLFVIRACGMTRSFGTKDLIASVNPRAASVGKMSPHSDFSRCSVCGQMTTDENRVIQFLWMGLWKTLT